MARINREWTVGSHGPLEDVDEGLLSVAGEIMMPLGRFPRRMTVAALTDAGAAIWSPIPLREAEMRTIEALGAPRFLIVPGIAHRLDIAAWKARYPEARILCPPGARDAVAEIVPVDATSDMMNDPAVRLEVVPGVEGKEAALIVRRGDRLTLVLNDILANVRHPHGLGAKLMARLMGFGVKRPQMPWVGKRMFVKDGAALAAALIRWSEEPALKRIIVSHGDIITDDPRGALARVAKDIA